MAQLYWYCDFCRTGNHSAADFCGSCGNPRSKPSFFDKLTPGLLVAGGMLFGAGMTFGALIGFVSRPSQQEARALISPRPTISPVLSPSITPASSAAPIAKKPSPTPIPSGTPVIPVEPDFSEAPRTESRSSSGSDGYIRGPRGGCYYINSRGNKKYVDRGLCGSEASSVPLYSAPSKPSSSRVYITGPRGGCYYINSNGNKTYVDHSFCN